MPTSTAATARSWPASPTAGAARRWRLRGSKTLILPAREARGEGDHAEHGGGVEATALAGSRENLLELRQLPLHHPSGGPPPHRFATGRMKGPEDLTLHMHPFLAFYRLLSPARRRQFFLTLALMLVGAAAE